MFSPFSAGEELAWKLENLGAYLSQNSRSIENIHSDPATIAHYSQEDMLARYERRRFPIFLVNMMVITMVV